MPTKLKLDRKISKKIARTNAECRLLLCIQKVFERLKLELEKKVRGSLRSRKLPKDVIRSIGNVPMHYTGLLFLLGINGNALR